MARSRYTSWHWQPTSRVATQIKQGGKRYRTARELQISQRTGDYTMAQVKAALEQNIGPVVPTTRKPAVRKPAAKTTATRTAAAKKATGKANVAKPVATKAVADGTPLKSIIGNIDPKLARRKLRKSGILASHASKSRYMLTNAEVAAVKKLLGVK